MQSIYGELVLTFQVGNYYVMAGLNSTGVSSSGGYGHVLSQWIAAGR